VNAYWRIFKNRILLSTEARQYKARAAGVALERGCKPALGFVAVSLWVYRARRIGDLDNFLKAALDSLRGVAFEDDSQVIEIHAYRHDDKNNPRVEVEVSEK
jgi:Holliday junction resolvase RusA-like endonuclease